MMPFPTAQPFRAVTIFRSLNPPFDDSGTPLPAGREHSPRVRTVAVVVELGAVEVDDGGAVGPRRRPEVHPVTASTNRATTHATRARLIRVTNRPPRLARSSSRIAVTRLFPHRPARPID